MKTRDLKTLNRSRKTHMMLYKCTKSFVSDVSTFMCVQMCHVRVPLATWETATSVTAS